MFYFALSLVLLFLYLANKYFFSYWSNRNVAEIGNPTPIFGNAGGLFTFRSSMGEFFDGIYQKYKHKKFIAAYLTYRPILIINDPELIQDIMIREFTTFHDRPTPGDAAKDYPLVGNLFNLRGQQWRDLRVKLSPTFSSGKLKVMFPIMNNCGKVLQDFVEKNVNNGNGVLNIKDLLSRFTINNIASVAFGIDNDCINEPDNAFRKMGMKIFDTTLRNGLINMLAFFAPALFTALKINPFEKDLEEFIYSIVNETIEYREKNNYQRNDFMQMLIQLKNQGYVSPDKDEHGQDEKSDAGHHDKVTKLTIDQIAAQAFIFFGAGFETSSSTMFYCLYELCRNPDIQKKVHEEFDRVMNAADSKELTYEILNEMKYLDCCIDETLRKYPILPALFREAAKDLDMKSMNLKIEKGTAVFIPLLGIQRDPDIYDEPLEFKPERFLNSPNGNGKGKGLFYLPFGDGPRNCIGSRLGKLQAKLGLALILGKFNFELNDKSLGEKELQFNHRSLVLAPADTILVKASMR